MCARDVNRNKIAQRVVSMQLNLYIWSRGGVTPLSSSSSNISGQISIRAHIERIQQRQDDICVVCCAFCVCHI